MKKKFILQFKYLVIFALVLLMMALDFFIYKKVLNKQVQTDIFSHYTAIANKSYQKKPVTVYGNIKALLNAQTTIKISKDSGAKKNILLDGDAVFFIPPGQQDSVFIYTNMLIIGTTGAAFRIQAHHEHAGQTLEMLSGKSRVSKAYSSPFPDPEFPSAGEIIMINKDIDLMEKEKSDTTNLVSWISDSLVFERNTFQQVIKKLEDWFDINFDITGMAPANFTFTHAFADADLKVILETLQKELKFNYRLDNKGVEIRF